MQKSLYTMSRSGVFIASKPTSNQCGREGHPAYNYTIKLVFGGENKLNVNNFIIEHGQIDATILASSFFGSCESMLAQMADEVLAMFSDYDIHVLGIKVDIHPSMNEGIAHIDYYRFNSKLDEEQIAIVIAALK